MINSLAAQTSVHVIVSHIHPSLIFAGKGGVYFGGAEIFDQGLYSQHFIFFITYESA